MMIGPGMKRITIMKYKNIQVVVLLLFAILMTACGATQEESQAFPTAPYSLAPGTISSGELLSDEARQHYEQGLGYQQQGQLPLAIVEFSKVIESEPEFIWAYLDRGFVYVWMGDLDLGLADYNRAIDLDPEDPNALAKKGAALEGLGRWKEAVPLFEKALSIKPASQIAKKGMNLAKFLGGLDIEI